MKHFKILVMAIIVISLFGECRKKDISSDADNTDLAQTNQTEEQKQYSAWSTPVNIGSAINTAANEQHPFLSKDGLSLYYSSNRTGTNGQLDIWVSERASLDSPWQTPVNLGLNINSNVDDMAPSLSPDEHWLYFHSLKPGNGLTDLYVAHRHDKRDNFGWEPAINLGSVINGSCDDAGPTYYENENGETILYFTSTRPLSGSGSCGDFNIFSSTRQADGSFGPGTYVPELSSPYRDTRTAIRRRDGLEIYISSERPGGPGIRNIWVSTRASTDDPWGTPVPVPNINSTVSDGAPALSFDAKSLIFFSNRSGGFGANDLYMSTRTHIH